jgi:hypothetical protein
MEVDLIERAYRGKEERVPIEGANLVALQSNPTDVLG